MLNYLFSSVKKVNVISQIHSVLKAVKYKWWPRMNICFTVLCTDYISVNENEYCGLNFAVECEYDQMFCFLKTLVGITCNLKNCVTTSQLWA